MIVLKMISYSSRCHYISEETNLSLWVASSYVGDSKSHIHLMVGCSDITSACGLEVYRASKQYNGYPHMIESVRKLRVHTQKTIIIFFLLREF